MKRNLVAAAAFLFAIFAICLQFRAHGYTASAAEISKARQLIGHPAPDFELAALDGGQKRLSDYRGKFVVLDFWATWCGPCRRSMAFVEQLVDKHPKIVVLALDIGQSAKTVQDFGQRNHVPGMILLDEHGKAKSLYHADRIPMQVLVDPKGVVREIVLGADPSLVDKLEKPILREEPTK